MTANLSHYLYHQDSAGEIYCGDCREILPLLPDNSVGLVLTDPPYGVGGSSGTKGKSRSHKHDYANDNPEYVKDHIVPAFIDSLRASGGVGIVTPGTLCLCFYPNPVSFGVFYQPATCGMQKWGRCDSQPIFFYGTDPKVGKTIQPCSFQVTERPSNTKHPCSKPIRVWTKLAARSLENSTILDPFLGSGTTAVAAKQLGRRFIGIEIEERYCEIAKQRLSQEELEL